MATRFGDRENRALIKKAIAYAEAQASNDADFVQILRATYFTQHPLLKRQLRVAANGTGQVRRAQSTSADPSLHIYDDPRFLENARHLAARAKKNLRIIGGAKVAGKEFPDCVAVGNDREWGCTGTLIAPKVVLSAGHCAKVATRVFFGNNVGKKGTIINVERAVQHPKYHKGKNNDLLLLLLEKASTVKPRRVAKPGSIDAATDGRAVGFGNVDATGMFGYGTKRQVDLPIASPGCRGRFSGETDVSAYGCDRDLEMVAGKPLLARDSCSGDSGGPFYIGNASGGWTLAGATSRSTKSSVSACGDGGIYVRVDQYREWIEDTAKVKLT
jgi:secreted trypsin-like serine protease